MKDISTSINNEISKEKVRKVRVPASEAKPRKTKNYINNADLMREINISRENDKMTDELTKMLMMLCKRYAQINRFSGYSYIDDMQSFALLTIVKVWKGFNPEKSQNPFAYFTQIIHNAFFQFDNQERKQRNIRDELLLSQGKNPSFNYLERMHNDSGDDSYGDTDSAEVHDSVTETEYYDKDSFDDNAHPEEPKYERENKNEDT